MLCVYHEIVSLDHEFKEINKSKSSLEQKLKSMKLQENRPSKYIMSQSLEYVSYLKGLSSAVKEFEDKLEESMLIHVISPDKNQNSNMLRQISNNKKKKSLLSHLKIIRKKIDSAEMLENMYNNLGHDYYTKNIKNVRKICHFGKLNTSYGMDYSQFTSFMQQNNMHDGFIDKKFSELIFNKVKGQNKSKYII